MSRRAPCSPGRACSTVEPRVSRCPVSPVRAVCPRAFGVRAPSPCRVRTLDRRVCGVAVSECGHVCLAPCARNAVPAPGLLSRVGSRWSCLTLRRVCAGCVHARVCARACVCVRVWGGLAVQVQKTEFDAIYNAFFDPSRLYSEGIRLKVSPAPAFLFRCLSACLPACVCARRGVSVPVYQSICQSVSGSVCVSLYVPVYVCVTGLPCLYVRTCM